MRKFIYLLIIGSLSITASAQKKNVKNLQPGITTNYLDASFKTYDKLQKEYGRMPNWFLSNRRVQKLCRNI